MTKRTRKKIIKAVLWTVGAAWSIISKLVHEAACEIFEFCKAFNEFMKNFSTISFLVALSAIVLFISLMFGPFKMCEFLVACWMCEVLWIWFHGEC